MSRLTRLQNRMLTYGARSCRTEIMLPQLYEGKNPLERACQTLGHPDGFFDRCSKCAVDTKENLTRALRALS